VVSEGRGERRKVNERNSLAPISNLSLKKVPPRTVTYLLSPFRKWFVGQNLGFCHGLA